MAEMEKHFYKKIYIINLCNVWHRSYSWPNTQHIHKLATEDLWCLRYCRSRVFIFIFFMQKLSGISSGNNNKSCGIFHHEANKIGFAFLWFLYDFIRNLQETAKSQVLFKNHFARRSLETSDSYEYTLAFAVRPLELKGASQCEPWRPAGAAPAEIRRPAALGVGKRWGETQGSPRGWFACSEG
jgi:hypothetical protein